LYNRRRSPMKKRIIAAAVLLCAPCLSPASSAEVILKEIRWQVTPSTLSRKPTWHDAAGWLQPPGSRLERQPRILVALLNRSAGPDEAVLLRYAVSARLVRIQDDGAAAAEGTWVIPFILEERRVPKIRGNDVLLVPIYFNRAVFSAYILRMRRAGFWPDTLRLQVMVEPRPGENSFRDRTMEAVLPVLWKQPSAAPPGGNK